MVALQVVLMILLLLLLSLNARLVININMGNKFLICFESGVIEDED